MDGTVVCKTSNGFTPANPRRRYDVTAVVPGEHRRQCNITGLDVWNDGEKRLVGWLIFERSVYNGVDPLLLTAVIASLCSVYVDRHHRSVSTSVKHIRRFRGR